MLKVIGRRLTRKALELIRKLAEAEDKDSEESDDEASSDEDGETKKEEE